jgi:translation initiation factor 6
MSLLRYNIHGNDYVGVYAAVTDRYLFSGYGLTPNAKRIMLDALGVECIEMSVAGSDLIGIFVRGNSNGVLFSEMADDSEVARIKKLLPGMNVERMESALNTVGNNMLVNDRIAIVNPEYTHEDEQRIRDVLGVEVVKAEIGGFKTVGANNILTNKGFIINNRSTDDEKEFVDKLSGFNSVRTTANTGSVYIGIAAVANAKGAVAGDATTGFELTRIGEGLGID